MSTDLPEGDDVARIRVCERIRHPAQYPPHFFHAHGTALAKSLRDRVALHITHDEEDEIVGFLDRVNGNDGRMTQLRRCFRLAQKARADVRAICELGRKNRKMRYLIGGFTMGPRDLWAVFKALLSWGKLELTEGWKTWGMAVPQPGPKAEETQREPVAAAKKVEEPISVS